MLFPESSTDFDKLIEYWFINFPYDYFYRAKYNIAFGSKQHLETNFLDMLVDLHTDTYIEWLRLKDKIEERKKTTIVGEELDKLYSNIDLENIEGLVEE